MNRFQVHGIVLGEEDAFDMFVIEFSFVEVDEDVLELPVAMEGCFHVLLELKSVSKHSGSHVNGGYFVCWDIVHKLEG